MTSLLSHQESTATAVPGVSVASKHTAGMCSPTHSDSRLAVLIDQRRALAAQIAGVDIEIAMAVGDRDAAQRARREMEAQAIARRAARECGCNFHERGEADRANLDGLVVQL